MAKKKLQQIDYACEVGDEVFVMDFWGKKDYGVLVEWNDNLATLKMNDGTTKIVEC